MSARGVRAFAVMLAAVALSLGPAALAQPAGGSVPPGQWLQTACSGHGQTNFNRCNCDFGWTGAQCDVQQEPPDCGQHGKVSGYRCACEPGWKGRTCQTPPPPVCVHGKLAHGACACDTGWSGNLCDKGP